MRTAVLMAGMLLLAAMVPRAKAHAFLDHAEPQAGGTITNSPALVKIWFTANLEPAFSAIEVRDAKGKEVDKKDSHQDAKDKSVLEVSLPPLKPGNYQVVWHVVSTDTHRTQGHFEFTLT